MKIILKHGYRQYMETTCPSCGCKFSYENEDIIKQPAYFYNHSGWKEYYGYDEDRIICPECGANFKISNWGI